MASYSVEHAVDIAPRLRALRAVDFEFATNHDAAGRIVTLVGVRVHHGVIDIVQIYGEHDADATRIPDTEPNILFPRVVLWRATGSASRVIDAVLELAEPDQDRPEAPPARSGCWMPASPGRSIWLPPPRSRTGDPKQTSVDSPSRDG